MTVITARRWFERTNGNTYHSVSVERNGKHVGYAPFTYGYGEQYLETAYRLIKKTKGFRGQKDSWAFRRHMQDHRNQYVVTVSDVSSKKDL